MVGEMSSPWRERAKRAVPAIVHIGRVGRLLRNQVRYPIAATIIDLDRTVLAGPFAGMRYPGSGVNGYPELLGTFEQCLTPAVEDIIRDPPPAVIVVGAACGYYALGFARTCPQTQVIAYEMDPTRVDVMRKYARLNRLEGRIEARAMRCTAADLRRDLVAEPRSFIFMDVEGNEDNLLDPDAVPELRETEIIVELHDMFVPGVTARIRQRFALSHQQRIFEEQPPVRPPMPMAFDRFLRPHWQKMAWEERGARFQWLHLLPQSPAMAERGPATQ